MTPIFRSLSKLFKGDPYWVDAFEVVRDQSFLVVASPGIIAYIRDLEFGEVEDA